MNDDSPLSVDAEDVPDDAVSDADAPDGEDAPEDAFAPGTIFGSRALADPRLALAVFALIELIALPVLLHAGRKRWFFGDDWFFLVATGYRTLFKTNTYGHWVTLPILAYHLLWRLFGLRTFTPYLFLVIALHLIAAALLRAVMRRSGAGPWISTIAASMLVFFGAGASDIFQPVQITFVGALMFGLAQLLLADHEGHIDWRDLLGLVCGLAALMCSNVGIAMVVSVGIAVLVRRGWRRALLHTIPLGVIYIVVVALAARSAHRLLGNARSLGRLEPFIWKGLRRTFVSLGHSQNVGLVLAALLVVGLVVAWTQASAEARRRPRPAAALIVGAFIFIASAGLLRASRAITPASQSGYVSRYVYISAALLLPALAVAITALIRRWRVVAPIAVIALLIGMPGNYHSLTIYGSSFPGGYRRDFLVLANAPLLRDLRPLTRIPAAGSPGYMSVGWIVKGLRAGRIPEPGHVTPKEAATAELTLALSHYQVSRKHGLCRPVATKSFVLQTGEQIYATGRLHLKYLTADGAVSRPMQLLRLQRFQALSGPLRLRIERLPGENAGIIERCMRYGYFTPTAPATTTAPTSTTAPLTTTMPAGVVTP